MEWNKLLSARRLGKARNEADEVEPRSAFIRDWDRIVFSSAFRRMQDKTQVFPLAKNDYVRTRLTHSLEVASVGRSIGVLAGKIILNKDPQLSTLGLAEHDIGSIVSAACLAHDIGNPPFGHTGESAIQEWFAQNDEVLEGLSEQQRLDLLRFEGNAQGFRLLTALQYQPRRGGMQLTSAILGAFTKYPRPAQCGGTQTSGVSGKKFGFMNSETLLFSELAETLALKKKPGPEDAWQRHPLAFLVEAADDICYHIMDIEDGFKTGVVSYEALVELHRPWLQAGQLDRVNDYENRQQRAEYLRAMTVGAVIKETVSAFERHYDGLMEGTFDDELPAHFHHAQAFQAFKQLAKEKVYTARPVIEVEACGFEVIGGLLDAFVQAIRTKAGHSAMGKVRARTLLELLPGSVQGEASTYQQLLMATDFISGMTDSYAVELYQRIRGISLP